MNCTQSLLYLKHCQNSASPQGGLPLLAGALRKRGRERCASNTRPGLRQAAARDRGTHVGLPCTGSRLFPLGRHDFPGSRRSSRSSSGCVDCKHVGSPRVLSSAWLANSCVWQSLSGHCWDQPLAAHSRGTPQSEVLAPGGLKLEP